MGTVFLETEEIFWPGALDLIWEGGGELVGRGGKALICAMGPTLHQFWGKTSSFDYRLGWISIGTTFLLDNQGCQGML